MFFLGIGLAIVGATARGVNLDAAQIGYLLAAQNIGFGVSVVISGALADRFRKSLMLTVGLVMLGLSFAFLYRSEVFAVNLGVMILMGLGMGVVEAVTDSWLLEMHTRNESRLVTINHFFVSIGSVVITLYLMALELDWETSLLQVAIVLAGLSLLVVFLRPPGHVAERRAGDKPFRRLSTDPGIILLVLAGIGIVGLEIGSSGVITTFVTQLRGGSTEFAQLLLALYLIGIAAGRVLVGLVGARVSPGTMVIVAAGAAMLGAVLFFLVPFEGAVLGVFATFLGVAAGPLLPLTIATAGLRHRDVAGTAMGMVKLSMPVGGIVIPGLVGVVSDTVGFTTALFILPASALLVLVVTVLGERRGGQTAGSAA